MADELGLDELRAHALTSVGMAKNALGDTAGVEDMEHALEIALDDRLADCLRRSSTTSPCRSSIVGDLRRAEELYAESCASPSGSVTLESVRFTRTNRI